MCIIDAPLEEMREFLDERYSNMVLSKEEWEFEREEAIYWFCNHYHGGQYSKMYQALCGSEYRPGIAMEGPPEGTMSEVMYSALIKEYCFND